LNNYVINDANRYLMKSKEEKLEDFIV